MLIWLVLTAYSTRWITYIPLEICPRCWIFCARTLSTFSRVLMNVVDWVSAVFITDFSFPSSERTLTREKPTNNYCLKNKQTLLKRWYPIMVFLKALLAALRMVIISLSTCSRSCSLASLSSIFETLRASHSVELWTKNVRRRITLKSAQQRGKKIRYRQ